MSEKFALRDALSLTILLLIGVHVAEAQQPGRIPWIGFLGNTTAALEENLVEPVPPRPA